MAVEIYTSPTCGYCHQAKQYLSDRGVIYEEFDVSRDRTAAQKMVELTGQMGVPVIVINGEVVIGFNRPRVDELLSRNGNSGGGYGHKPKLGLKVADAKRYSYQDGAYVGLVEGGSMAERAGLRAGDTIVSIDSDKVVTAADLEEVLGRHDGRVTVVFIRNEKAMQTQLSL